MSKIDCKPVNKKRMRFRIVGTSPLITHAWSEKAKTQMREKHAGSKSKNREKRDPEAEMKAALYVTDDDDIGIPGMAFKAALVSAAHKDIGIEKTWVRKAIFLRTSDSNKILKMDECSPPTMREDMVRVGVGQADIRYRPQFDSWSVVIELEVDCDILQESHVLNLTNRAGFGVGLCEWRPEKGGEYGRFEVDGSFPFEIEEL